MSDLEREEMGSQPALATSPDRSSSVLLFWIAALLPLLGYLGSIGLAEAKRWGAPRIEVAIDGYDPRDLVRGHYVRYRVRGENLADAGWDTSFCSGKPVNGISPIHRFSKTSEPPECLHSLPSEFVTGNHRYYIQQDKGPQLEEAIRNGRGTIRLKVINSREVAVEALLIDGKVPQ